MEGLSGAEDRSEWPAVSATVGRRVRAARRALKLTQEELAARAGVTRVTVSQLERGHRQRLNPDLLRAIAQATDQTEEYFYSLLAPERTDASGVGARGGGVPPYMETLLPRIASLPAPQQAKFGSVLEQLLGWFEEEPMVIEESASR
jgi:transcriptional regulator with XRE-family HTH domain